MMSMREKRKRKQIRRCRRLFVLLLAVVVLMGYYIGRQERMPYPESGFSRAVYGSSKSSRHQPVEYSGKELEQKLSDLSGESKEYAKLYERRGEYPEELLSAVCNNAEMLDFALGYAGTVKKASGGLRDAERKKKDLLLLQWDKRWGYVSYGKSCIGLTGCAPTCLSMVCQLLSDHSGVTPDKVAKFAEENGYYRSGAGTSWSLMTEGASHFGLRGAESDLSRDVIFAELDAGHPIICSMRPGDFTSQGHFIVLRAVQDGKIKVLDPNSKYRSSILWDYECLKSQIKNLWCFQSA